MRALVAASALALSLLLGSGPASAQEPPVINVYLAHWALQSAPTPTEPTWVAERGLVVERPLTPVALYLAESDVSDERGRKLVPAGTQLVRIVTRPDRAVVAACNVRRTTNREYLTARKHVCLVDGDGDGAFEYWFERQMSDTWAFAPRGWTPSLKPMASVALTSLDPSTITAPPVLRLHYLRTLEEDNALQRLREGESLIGETKLVAGRIRFSAEVFSGSGATALFTDTCGGDWLTTFCASSDYPSTAIIAGTHLHIAEGREDEILVSVDGTFDPIVLEFNSLDGDGNTRTGDYGLVSGEGIGH